MNETNILDPKVRKRTLQFRVATLFWVMIVVAAFFAGRYSAQPTGGKTTIAPISATWNPRYSATYAIAGPIDIDGDGADDSAMLKKLISKNGGTVVASRDSAGFITGKIDGTTCFLVVEDPTDPTITSNKLVLDANKNSVPLIGAEKLLKRIGVQTDKTENGFQTRKTESTAE